MKYVKQEFGFWDDESSGRVFSDIAFYECQFVGGGFSTIDLLNWRKRDLVEFRSLARNVLFRDCRVSGVSFIGPGIVEDSIVENLEISNHLQTKGTAFKHVTFKGNIDKLMLVPNVDFTGQFPDIQEAFDKANEAYYRTVDWALDISEASFKDCDIRAIPARLIRRDAKTQAVLTRQKALEMGWKDVDLSKTHWPTSIEWFIDSGFDDIVLVAPKRAKNFQALLDGISRMRDAGVLEPS